jgi:hypothetical protein
MSPNIGLMLVSVLSAALLADPASARSPQPHHARQVGLERTGTVGQQRNVSARRLYLLERRGAANTNAFKHFDSQFILDP